jgi:hypothetical protein
LCRLYCRLLPAAADQHQALLATAAAGLQILSQQSLDDSESEIDACRTLAHTLRRHIAAAADAGATLTRQVSHSPHPLGFLPTTSIQPAPASSQDPLPLHLLHLIRFYDCPTSALCPLPSLPLALQLAVGLLEACARADIRLGLVPSFGNTVALAIQFYVAQGFSSGEVSPGAGRRAGGWVVHEGTTPSASCPCRHQPLTAAPTPPLPLVCLQFAPRLAAARTTLNGHRNKHGSADFGRSLHQQQQQACIQQGAPASSAAAAVIEADSAAMAHASSTHRAHQERE